MSVRLNRKPTALVTGASSGMGLEYARQLAEAGCSLVMISNEEEKLSQAAGNLQKEFGIEAIARYADLALDSAAEDLVAWCDEQGLEIDILINNAGFFFFKEMSEELYPRMKAMMQLHTATPARLCVLLGEKMKQRGCGYIVNMASVAAKLPVPGITTYSATKAFLKSFSQSLWYEYRPYGVRVTTVCPGAVATPLYHLKPSLMKLGCSLGVIKSTKSVVRKALKGVYKGRKTVNPGLMSYYLPPLIYLIPRRLVCYIWKKIK